MHEYEGISSIPPIDLGERGGGQDKNEQENWQVQDVLGTFLRCLWSVPKCLWPGEKNGEKCTSGGDLLKGLRLRKKGVLLAFLQCFIAFNRKAHLLI